MKSPELPRIAAQQVLDKARCFRAALQRSPGLALVTAVAAGFVAGLLLRCLERQPEKRPITEPGD